MGIVKYFQALVPAEKRFFEMLEEQAEKVLEGVELLDDMLRNGKDLEADHKKLHEIEEEGDHLRHRIVEDLHTTFITPIDHEDINRLSASLDDVLDFADSAANRLLLFEFKKTPDYFLEMSRILKEAATHVNSAVKCLDVHKSITDYHIKINQLENDADDVKREALKEILKSKDAVGIIKRMEVLKRLENAVDRCEDVGDVLADIKIKHS